MAFDAIHAETTTTGHAFTGQQYDKAERDPKIKLLHELEATPGWPQSMSDDDPRLLKLRVLFGGEVSREEKQKMAWKLHKAGMTERLIAERMKLDYAEVNRLVETVAIMSGDGTDYVGKTIAAMHRTGHTNAEIMEATGISRGSLERRLEKMEAGE